jgi:NAD(P)H-nitrite reductase large subunit
MSTLHVKYLLVGGGLAASSAAEAIRALDRGGALLLVGQEVNRPYHRPPLSKEFLRRDKERAELWVKPLGWYEENDVVLRTGHRVAHLDCERRAVTLSSGEEISFDRLLLATGAAPRPMKIPGADLPNIFYLRTIEDAERIQHAIDQAKAEGRKHARGGRGHAVVIGGGVLGVETAASLTQSGLHVHLIAARYPWEKFAGESTGRFLVRHLESKGVTVHTGHRPQRLEGDGRVQRVVLPAGQSIPCDFVAAAVGINVNREILRGTPIAAERAILADERCRTNVEHVYAAGDCAAVFDPLFGKHRLLDHWDNAQITGRIAGTNMAGGEARYDAVNYFFSDVFDLTLSGWGEARQVSHRLTRGTPTPESPALVEIGIAADGRIAQVLAVNHSNEDDLLRELVKRRVRVEGKEEDLKDPSRSLAELLERA